MLLSKYLSKIRIMRRKYPIAKWARNTTSKALVDDKRPGLTEDQKNSVLAYYEPYRKVSWIFHEFYYKKTGLFFENYLPDDLYYCDIDMYYNDWEKARFIDNKCYYRRIFGGGISILNYLHIDLTIFGTMKQIHL